MSVSRRIFLWNGALAAAACAAIPLEAIGQRRQVPGEPAPIQAGLHSSTGAVDPYAALAHMDRDRFTSAIGSDFMLASTSGSPTVSLRLLAVKDLPGPPPPDPAAYVTRNLAVPFVGTTGFMLLFATTSPDALPQDTYSFNHATLGPFVMFIVPEGLGKGQYSAIVNRLNAPVTAAPVSAVGRAQVPSASPTGTASGSPPASSAGPALGSPASTSSDSGNPAPQQVGNRGARKAAERD